MLKRTVDIVASSFGLLMSAPFLFLIAFLIWREDKGPAFYKGTRVGRRGKPFEMLKFRTMVIDAEKRGASSTAEDDPRLTKIGKRLRKYKLDELPQLMNVFRGEMSIVGPRPQVAWAVEIYTKEEKALLDVRPGITDLASIQFSNEGEILRGSSDPDKTYLEKIAPGKIRLGLFYVRNQSFFLDLRIVLATIWACLGGNPHLILGAQKNEPDGTETS